MDTVDRALRYNQGKLMLELIPPEFEEEIGKVFTKGASKYSPDNWKRSLNTEDHDQFVRDRIGSAKRHIMAHLKGEHFDDEMVPGAEHIQTRHLAQAVWNLLVVMYYAIHDERNSVKGLRPFSLVNR